MTIRTKQIDYGARRDPQTDFYCVACQKDMDRTRPARAVHLICNFPLIALHPADELVYVPDGSDMGCFPIGECCAKKLGREWTFPKSLWPQR